VRVHELAGELGTDSNEVLEVINDQPGNNVDHHMSTVNEETARRVRLALQNSDEVQQAAEVPGTGPLRSLFDSTMDTVAFGVGLGLLLSSSHGDETRETIRDEIRDLGEEITNPIRIGGEEIISLLDVLPIQVNRLKQSALEIGNDSMDQIQPILEGVFGEASELVGSTNIPSNGQADPEKAETKK
jgi:hypothetical protein